MKTAFTIIAVFCATTCCVAQVNGKHEILSRFVAMQNTGTDEAVKQFISETYLPELLVDLDMAGHLAFYRQIITEFGPLNPRIFEKVAETETKLIVHLIKENEVISNTTIPPKDILVVEIDVAPRQPAYLSRGLGLGALVCSIRKNK